MNPSMLIEGQRLGDFEILDHIGQGGMGAVFKARQISLLRVVALKTLKPFVSDDPDYVARFHQEAVAAAALNHPNLVQVYAAGEADGIHYFAMEYIEGESAHARLVRLGRLDSLEAIALATHVAAALEHGWRKAGLIHRDIKPDNIFLSMEGEVKLGDLGLAKSAGQSSATQSGTALGTPHYISPEQAEGKKEIDLRADIYGLGCTLYHLLSGQPPYAAESAVAIMLKHVSAPVPDLRGVWPQCPAELAALVMKMMQKAPADRLQSHTEVSLELRRVYDLMSGAAVPGAVTATTRATAQSKSAVRGNHRAGRGVAWTVGGLTVLALLGALLYFAPWHRERDPAKTPNAAAGAELRSIAPNQVESHTAAAEPTPPAPSAAADTGRTGESTMAARQPEAKPATPAPEPAAGAVPAGTTPAPVAAIPSPATPSPTPTAASASPKPPGEIERWIAQVDGPQQEAYQKKVVGPFESGLADLRARYRTALEAGFARTSAAGQLDEALAWRTEKEAFEKALNVSADDSHVPAALQALRAGFRQQLGKIDRERLAQAKALFGEYDTILAKDQTLLTQRGRVDDALLLKTKRDELARTWLAPSPLIAAAAASSPESAPPVALPPATKTSPFVNTLGMKFVPVRGTQVLFGVWDTRVQDYEAFVTATNRRWNRSDVPQGALYPAVHLSWDDAEAFCQWLTETESAAGKLPKGLKYRLPADEEWSRAVGLTSEEGATPADKSVKNLLDFPWGRDFPPKEKSGNYADTAFHGKDLKKPWIKGYTDGYSTTSPVGAFPPNEFGIYDMSGNVWQWCEDWFDAAKKDRFLRGGSWACADRNLLLSACRIGRAPNYAAYSDYGFRCVLAISGRP